MKNKNTKIYLMVNNIIKLILESTKYTINSDTTGFIHFIDNHSVHYVKENFKRIRYKTPESYNLNLNASHASLIFLQLLPKIKLFLYHFNLNKKIKLQFYGVDTIYVILIQKEELLNQYKLTGNYLPDEHYNIFKICTSSYKSTTLFTHDGSRMFYYKLSWSLL